MTYESLTGDVEILKTFFKLADRRELEYRHIPFRDELFYFSGSNDDRICFLSANNILLAIPCKAFEKVNTFGEKQGITLDFLFKSTRTCTFILQYDSHLIHLKYG
ncbi:MAG: hypothetical protein JW969_13035 [Spirochaetales bacterium]|nr:hypothetical protein [Spirochaetales bacterium]